MCDQALEVAKNEVRSRGMKVTPYRVGLAMGRAYHSSFWAWSSLARKIHVYEARPEAPACPYSNVYSFRAWRDGFQLEMAKPRPQVEVIE